MSAKLGRSVIAPSIRRARFRRRSPSGPADAARRGVLLAAASLLAGCAVGSGPGPVADIDPARKTLIADAQRLEIGRVTDGFALTGFGVTEGAGWSLPELRPRGAGVGSDGVLEFDFVALPPAEPVAAAEGARRIRGDALIPFDRLVRANGVRIYGRRGFVEGLF